MITHTTVKNETEKLSKLMVEHLEIPSMFACVKPAIFLELWMIICPLLSFLLAEQRTGDLLSAVGGGAFLGVIVSFAIINGRSLYLSLPREFRESSEVLLLLTKKIGTYAKAYGILVLMISLSAAYSGMGSLAYLIPLVFCTVMTGFIFNIDIGRYRLSAFTSVLELLKSRKQGGE
ncbi:hypothetical protein I5P72_23000 [Serratia ureilytica]|uniref:hypothetical protein n=1 Tax=Serratia ureilytica TaxID=300181 RepID=UPI0018D8E529|nr:hypothetical protein [Serratia ureilytica]MBH3120243.1 hypothetical protein [Serratia ureilytica]